jgi:hypothetical protein
MRYSFGREQDQKGKDKRQMRSHAAAAIGRGGTELAEAGRTSEQSNSRTLRSRELAHGPVGKGGERKGNGLVNPSNSIQTSLRTAPQTLTWWWDWLLN